MNTRRIGVHERRARLAVRHHLETSAQVSDPRAVAQSIVAYHATDPASVYLAAAARTGFAPPAALDAALYDDRTLVRAYISKVTPTKKLLQLLWLGICPTPCRQNP